MYLCSNSIYFSPNLRFDKISRFPHGSPTVTPRLTKNYLFWFYFSTKEPFWKLQAWIKHGSSMDQFQNQFSNQKNYRISPKLFLKKIFITHFLNSCGWCGSTNRWRRSEGSENNKLVSLQISVNVVLALETIGTAQPISAPFFFLA